MATSSYHDAGGRVFSDQRRNTSARVELSDVLHFIPDICCPGKLYMAILCNLHKPYAHLAFTGSGVLTSNTAAGLGPERVCQYIICSRGHEDDTRRAGCPRLVWHIIVDGCQVDESPCFVPDGDRLLGRLVCFASSRCEET